MERRGGERLFATLLFVSFLLNVNQCSKSNDFDEDTVKYESSEIKSELILLKKEIEKINLLLQEKEESVVEVIKITKPVVAPKPTGVDSIATHSVVDVIDSVKTVL